MQDIDVDHWIMNVLKVETESFIVIGYFWGFVGLCPWCHSLYHT
jgi:hypothetical protein